MHKNLEAFKEAKEMQEKSFDVWSPVDESNFRRRALWITGTLVSLVLLILSFVIESGILVLLDGVLPLGMIICGIIKNRKYPVYYYTLCLSGIYPICWFIFISPDFSSEAAEKSTNYFVLTVAFIVFAVVVLALLLLITVDRKSLSQKKTKEVLPFDRTVLVLALGALLATQFFAVNVLFDKPYKTETGYVKDIRGPAKGFSGTVYYIEANSGESHSIEFNDNIFTEIEILKRWDSYDWVLKDANENYMLQIEYGHGAFGIPWRRIVGNE